MTQDEFNTSIIWDVLVVGTGVGGATLGHALATLGLKVLFLEKGGRTPPANTYAEETTPEGRLSQGWWPHPVSQLQADGTHRRFFAAVGCAMGGSSIHYGAALERMEASDFAPLPNNAMPGTSWPVSHQEFIPYYRAAERLFRAELLPREVVMQRMSDWDRALMEQMKQKGLNPDPLNVAMRYDEQCTECIGTICARNCKSDALASCLDQALRLPNAKILDYCDVQTLDADSNEIRSVRAVWRGRELRLSAKIVVLAAGAFHSPQILLRSTNTLWPHGLANSSDQVGRNLMFHTSDIFAIWAPRRLDRRGRQKKSISLRDFYLRDGRRLGYVQSMGLEAGRGLIASYLKDQLRRTGLRNEQFLSMMAKLPSHIGAFMFGNAGLFVGSTEDDPNPENRITLDPNEPNGASFTYTITDDLRQRAHALYKSLATQISPWRIRRISPRIEMNYGHPCGTCRFGNDPAQSVLDRNCRTHDINNLYVVDSSFMPRSGAVNPSLTIAANALRVAEHIAGRQQVNVPYNLETVRKASPQAPIL